MENILMLIGYGLMTTVNVYVTWENLGTYKSNNRNLRKENENLKDIVERAQRSKEIDFKFFCDVAKREKTPVGFLVTAGGTTLITQEWLDALAKIQSEDE